MRTVCGFMLLSLLAFVLSGCQTHPVPTGAANMGVVHPGTPQAPGSSPSNAGKTVDPL